MTQVILFFLLLFYLVDDSEKLKGTEMTEEEKEVILYEPGASDWPDCGRDTECDRISNCLEQVPFATLYTLYSLIGHVNNMPTMQALHSNFQNYSVKILYAIID